MSSVNTVTLRLQPKYDWGRAGQVHPVALEKIHTVIPLWTIEIVSHNLHFHKLRVLPRELCRQVTDTAGVDVLEYIRWEDTTRALLLQHIPPRPRTFHLFLTDLSTDTLHERHTRLFT